MHHSLKSRLSHRVDLSLSAFRARVPRGTVDQLSFESIDAQRWYEEIRRLVTESRSFLPIYRMADGEFAFACGHHPSPVSFFFRYPRIAISTWTRHLANVGRSCLPGARTTGFSTCWGEEYTPREWSAAKESYARRVAQVAEEGILAINFVKHAEFPRQYVGPMCRWMERNGIELNRRNYYPFYFVYALCLGSDAPLVYGGRRILVVTSDDDGTKAPAIIASLRSLGARDVKFTRISSSKAMFDRIDVSSVGHIDLVLIGAGIGALNILEQVRPLGAVSIDAGFVLDCLWKPHEFVGRRAFTAPDVPLAGLEAVA